MPALEEIPTEVIETPQLSTRRLRLAMFGCSVLTYGVGYWIVVYNPYFSRLVESAYLHWNDRTPTIPYLLLALFTVVVGRTPVECIIRATAVAIGVQLYAVLTLDDDELNIEQYRPFVFWRAMFRFLKACAPWLRGNVTGGTPHTGLTDFEKVTVRYYFVKLLYMPMMIGFFFGNFQRLIDEIYHYVPHLNFTTGNGISDTYLMLYMALMVIDVGWFAIGCSVETKRFSRVIMVDPYASGWLVTLACYVPFNSIVFSYFPWQPPEFPNVTSAPEAVTFAIVGLALFTFYVVADLSFGLKTGNLVFRGLINRGPYRLIRHPMYTSKTLCWFIFSIPVFAFHLQAVETPWHQIWMLPAGNFGVLWAAVAWVLIYAARAFTEERYLLTYPDYREYCKQVKWRFIPGLI